MSPLRYELSFADGQGVSGGAAPWITLLELNQQVRGVVVGGFPDACQVVAEVASIRVHASSGHAYLELVEHRDREVVARMKGVAFRNAYERICGELESAEVGPPEVGMKLLLTVRVRFHEQYGLQLHLEGVDPTYTLGEAERRKREVLERLRREDLIDRNKIVPFPLVPQRIAIVSSQTAAAFEDFVNQLERNPYGFRFRWSLFDARVQGDGASASLVSAFCRVGAHARLFDVVVLIRGGGSATDLACFNDYDVTAKIARCPLPVITGIGHDRDATLADLVAHTSVKTPTAAAETLLDALQQYENRVNAAGRGLYVGVTRILQDGRVTLDRTVDRLGATVERRLVSEHGRVDAAVRRARCAAHAYLVDRQQELETLAVTCHGQPGGRLSSWEHEVTLLHEKLACWTERMLEREQHRIEGLEGKVRLGDPEEVLRRGYSITYRNGKALKEAGEVSAGDRIETQLLRGSIVSTVGGGER